MLLLLLETSSVVDKKSHSLQLYYRRAPLYLLFGWHKEFLRSNRLDTIDVLRGQREVAGRFEGGSVIEEFHHIFVGEQEAVLGRFFVK